jgi:glutamate/tyrosine decarboxylase-like PLP-dependent enzyme
LIDQNIAQADYLTGLIKADPNLELTTETSINIVWYRYNPGCMTEKALKQLNTEIIASDARDRRRCGIGYDNAWSALFTGRNKYSPHG